jgi:DNA polymerase III alpha subunit
LGGTLVEIKPIVTKNGKDMAFMTIEDWHPGGKSISLVLFPKTWDMYADGFEIGDIVFVRGSLEQNNGRLNVIVDQIQHIGETQHGRFN